MPQEQIIDPICTVWLCPKCQIYNDFAESKALGGKCINTTKENTCNYSLEMVDPMSILEMITHIPLSKYEQNVAKHASASI
jgi:hypothetical protein